MHKYKDFFKELITESMTLFVAGEDYEDKGNDEMLGVSFKLSRKAIDPIYSTLSDADKKYFDDNRPTEILVPDGGDEFKETGQFNFYTSGFKPDTIKKIIDAIKYYAKEYNLTLGTIRGPEQSKMYKNQVMRIPVLNNGNVGKTTSAPELNLSNDNMVLIFNKVLGYKDFNSSDGDTFNSADLIKRVNTVLDKAKKDEEYLYRVARPPSVDGGTGKVTMIIGGADPEYIIEKLNTIKNVCEYAITHRRQNVSVSQ
jgi:hypothetical protein